jgi:hypothetical protein
MKNKILSFLFIILALARIEAAEIVNSNKDGIQPLSSGLPKSGNSLSNQQEWDNGLNVPCTCPFELQERSEDFFGNLQFEASARSTIAAAIHGNYDYIAFLYDIDPESHKYLISRTPQSPEALTYYGKILLPKVIKHGELEFIKLQRHQNMPIILYYGQTTQGKMLT